MKQTSEIISCSDERSKNHRADDFVSLIEIYNFYKYRLILNYFRITNELQLSSAEEDSQFVSESSVSVAGHLERRRMFSLCLC